MRSGVDSDFGGQMWRAKRCPPFTLTALIQGNRWGTEFTTTACEVGRDSARRLNLAEEVQTSLFHVYDLWRGKDGPGGLTGDDIPVEARIARLNGIAVMFESIGGSDLA